MEVSFDIKQENLSQILEPTPPKLPQEELDIAADRIDYENVLVLSGTTGTQKFLDLLLTRNKIVKKLIYPRNTGALCRRKAQEYSIQAEQLSIIDGGTFETDGGIENQIPLLQSQKVLMLSSTHYDPLFGLSSSASEVVRLLSNLKQRVYAEFSDSLPISYDNAESSQFALKMFGSLTQVGSLELIEKAGLGIVALTFGDILSTHSEIIERWKNALSISAPKSERIIFGCGGGENDRNLTDAFGRALFPILASAALPESDAKICMLAECGSGLGSEAFLRFVTGRLDPRSKIGGVDYVDGLETLVAFQKLQADFNLNILTTLPKFYASKFGLKTIGGAREAPSSLVTQGSRAKILVLPDASSALFKV